MDQPAITLSINPSYLCNFRCSFCYLSKEQLGNPEVLDNEKLFRLLSEVASKRKIEHIDLYGGEVALIPKAKLSKMLETISFFYPKKINIITNLSLINPLFLTDKITLSVSWDFIARERHHQVYLNMLSLKKDFHILILASEELIEMEEKALEEMIHLLNQLPYLRTVEIKPYSSHPHSSQIIKYDRYENWILKWIRKSSSFKFEFMNLTKIKDAFDKKYSSWSDDHLYLTPHGRFAVLEFNEQYEEYFLELNHFEDYLNWSNKEKKTIVENKFCQSCNYLGHCLSEHLQNISSMENSCNGFKGLLDWYSNNR